MTEKKFNLIDKLLGWLMFVVALTVYMLTLEPTASFWDCGEFITAAHLIEVGHPPGAPLFLLIGRIFSLFASDHTQVAYMVNTVSAIASAMTIMFLYWTIVYFAKRMIAFDKIYTTGKTIAIAGAGIVGALIYTFSDTFWFSAVEAEVYASSSFFTAIVFWAILKWSEVDNVRKSTRWLLLIALLTGMAIGVHLLNLLTIPALALVIYYKKYKPTTLGFTLTAIISILTIAIIMWGLIPGVGIIASKIELCFVNDLGFSFNSGMLVWVLLTISSLVLSIYYTQYSKNRITKIIFPSTAILLTGATFISDSFVLNILLLTAAIAGICVLVKKQKNYLLNLIMTSFTLLMFGYSIYAVIIIRSSANPPMDQSNPDNVFNFVSYLNREQYGDRPLLYGRYFSADYMRDRNGNIIIEKGEPIYIKRIDTTTNKDKYVIIDYQQNYKYDKTKSTIFPRMYSNNPAHIEIYKLYGNQNQEEPNFNNNISFFINYQMNLMYWRYFMWNFAGRQNDIQGYGNSTDGNWISGISFIDNARLGDQNKLPDYLKNNKANNKYYMLPLLLGLMGLSFQLFRHRKDWTIVTFLFILTGIAIVIYLNQTPNQPRERDYAYAGSFYAFSIWTGLGVLLIYRLFEKFMPLKLGKYSLMNYRFQLFEKFQKQALSATLATLLSLSVPLIMATENWDDHNRSNRYFARNFGYNYLISCQPDAILFTMGDNDTFPVWYTQEVENVRKDIKVCCLPYFQSDWYIDQMKQKYYNADPMPISFTKDMYEPSVREILYFFSTDKTETTLSLRDFIDYIKDKKSIIKDDDDNIYTFNTHNIFFTDSNNDTLKIKIKRHFLLKSELMFLDMILNNNWERPIYFTSINPFSTLDISNYLENKGFVYKLCAKKTDNNEDIIYDNLFNKCKWDSFGDTKVYVDETIQRSALIVGIRNKFIELALSYYKNGNIEKCEEVMLKCDSLMNEEQFPLSFDDM